MSEAEEVVGKCGPEQISANDLDNSYVFVSDEDDSGKGIHFQEGEKFRTKSDDDISSSSGVKLSSTINSNEVKSNNGEVVEIADNEGEKSDEGLGLGAESNDDIAAANGAKLSGSSISNPINKEDVDQFLLGGEAASTNNQQMEVDELPPKEVMNEVVQIADYEVPESKPMDTEEEKINLESQDVSSAEDDVKLSEGEVVANVAGCDLQVTAEVLENAERGSLDLEANPVYAKDDEIDADANVVECETRDASAQTDDELKLSEGEVVENAEENLSLESDPVNTKETIFAVANVVEHESQDAFLKVEPEVKLSREVVAEHENLNLESNPVNTNGEINAAANVVELEWLDTSVKAEEDGVQFSCEVVENAEQENLNLELNPVNANEEINVASNVVELESLDSSMKAEEDKVKLSGEVVENGEREILNLESNPVNAFVDIDATANFVELESLDMSLKAEEDKVKLSGEVVENAEREILESNPVNSNEEIDAAANVVELESLDTSVKAEEDKVRLSGEVVENAERQILNLELNDVDVNEEIDVAANVVELESLDMSLKAEEDMVKLSGEVVENAERETLDLELNPVNSNEEIDAAVNVVELESLDTSVKAEEDKVKLSGEVVENAERKFLNLESNPMNSNEKIDAAVNVVELESQDTSMKAEEDKVKLSGEVVENAEREILNLELNDVNANEEIDAAGNVVELESLDMSSKAEEDKIKLSSEVIAEHEEVPPATSYLTLEPEVGIPIFSAIISSENSSDANKGNNTELEIESVEDKVDQIDAENLVLRDNDDTGNSQDNNTPVDPPRVEEASIKTKRKPFNFLIKVPRFDNESLREQIRLAKINVDGKTKLRDSIQVQIQEKRASTQVHGIDFEYAKGESRNARNLVRLKRVEIDSLQSVINKAKNALSIGDIDRQMYNMEHMIQHETLPLKEEKQLIREIKQLKLLREQLSSNMGSKDEIKQALEQREEVEERLKILRKDLDLLKGKVVKAEAAAVEAQKKYDAENKEVKEIQAQFRAADGVRQAAYVQWQSLRKELSKKSEYFYKYKDDSAVANNCVFRRDTDALYRLCTNNVEKFMELWNTNDEFRRDYVQFNTRSTVWRLGTLDGRSLGPDEVPPVLPSYVDTRVNRNVSTPAKVDLISQFPTLEPKHVKTTESVMSDDQSTKKSTEEKKQRAANKEPAISVQSNGPDTVSGQDIIINEVREEPKKSKEEIEAINKAEERERREAEAKLKEERRLEALAKASEARERKKKQAEKLQMRAELKTIKEAEQKEKEREKRLRKKERKKVTALDVNDTNGYEIAPSSESAAETTSKDVEVKDSSSAAAPKKLKKHWWFGKQSKAKSTIPPPLRNRNKKKLQQWMWMGITSCFILVMFVMGNMGVFSNVHFRQRNPVV